jgi:CheY-like chemotaxis protein
MLPEVHGYEVCHRVKTNPKTARIKVIMLTAKAFPADRHQAKDVGADDFSGQTRGPLGSGGTRQRPPVGRQKTVVFRLRVAPRP